MATLRGPSASLLSAFLPVARAQLLPRDAATHRFPLLHRIRHLRLHVNLLPAALTTIPSLLETLWDGLLKAVPKKKTSHMKKRHRQMAGKALKDVTALNKCSACGRLKKAHVLCPYCVKSIKQWFSNGFQSKQEVAREKERQFDSWNEELIARGQEPLKWEDLYDGKRDEKVTRA